MLGVSISDGLSLSVIIHLPNPILTRDRVYLIREEMVQENQIWAAYVEEVALV